MKTLQVALGERSYPIYIGPGLLQKPQLLAAHIPGKRVMVVSNTTVAPLYMQRCMAMLDGFSSRQVVLPDGEEYKNLQELNSIFDALLREQCDRGTTLIALGGGVIGDMTGFAASAYQRGVPFIQIPTTLLAQVDSSVGGKTGVNHALGKNMIGAFYQPRCVLADTDTLNTLDDRQLSCGLAEVIKYGVLGDVAFYRWLEQNMTRLRARDSEALALAIECACQDKADIVARDELESGVRALLNLGHTFGHAIESALQYKGWLHGEAVAVGMVMAAYMSWLHGWIEKSQVVAIEKLLLDAGLPVRPPAQMGAEAFYHHMARDKKVQAGKIRLVLLERVGKAALHDDYDSAHLDATIAFALSGEAL